MAALTFDICLKVWWRSGNKKRIGIIQCFHLLFSNITELKNVNRSTTSVRLKGTHQNCPHFVQEPVSNRAYRRLVTEWLVLGETVHSLWESLVLLSSLESILKPTSARLLTTRAAAAVAARQSVNARRTMVSFDLGSLCVLCVACFSVSLLIVVSSTTMHSPSIVFSGCLLSDTVHFLAAFPPLPLLPFLFDAAICERLF